MQVNKIVPGLKLKYKEQSCELDIMDWECNSPPLGFLWIRELKNIPVVHGLEQVDAKGSVLGMIHVLTGEMFDVTNIRHCVPPVPSMSDTVKLMYDIYFPKQLSLYKRILNFILRRK